MTEPSAPKRTEEFTVSEETFRLLVSAVKDYAIFMLDPQGYIMTWNEGAQRIKGYNASEIVGKHFSEFYTQEAKDRRHPQFELEFATKEGRYEEEGWRVRKDGTMFWASVVITAVHNDGKLIGFAKVTRDLTERKLAEQQREGDAKILATTNKDLREALEVKSRFLSTISHEVRTPMSGIIGMAELLVMEDLGADNNAIMHSIFESSKRLLQLLNNLLDSARMESGHVTIENRSFPIRSILGEVRQLVSPEASKKGLALTGSCDLRLPEELCGDELRIRQVLLNLAFNAVKFTQSGNIDISAELKSQIDDLTVVRFAVTDTGIGIKPEDHHKIFQPFVQAEDSTTRLYGGSGLGLSISKQLVQLMGGEIGFESEANKGSKFWFDVPFEQGNCRI
jgi:osomolarity two-component system sensor histidine kinase TcsA